jgi:hypothetical protein
MKKCSTSLPINTNQNYTNIPFYPIQNSDQESKTSAGKWVKLENIILSKVTQIQKAMFLSHMWNICPIQMQIILYIHRNI